MKLTAIRPCGVGSISGATRDQHQERHEEIEAALEEDAPQRSAGSSDRQFGSARNERSLPARTQQARTSLHSIDSHGSFGAVDGTAAAGGGQGWSGDLAVPPVEHLLSGSRRQRHSAADPARTDRATGGPDSDTAPASPPLLRGAVAQCAATLGGHRAGRLLNLGKQPFVRPEPEWLLWVCAVQRRRFPVGANPTRRNAPAGSNRSSHGGNEMAEAFG